MYIPAMVLLTLPSENSACLKGWQTAKYLKKKKQNNDKILGMQNSRIVFCIVVSFLDLKSSWGVPFKQSSQQCDLTFYLDLRQRNIVRLLLWIFEH